MMDKMGFRFHTVKIWTMYYGNRISVKRDTALKLTECTTDIEVIIKQVISAVPGNFWKIEFSSDA